MQSILESLVILIGPGMCAGLAVAKPKTFLWLALAAMAVVVYRAWPGTVPPEREVFLMFAHLIIAVSTAVGLFTGVLCTGRQHQEKESDTSHGEK